jgi:zeaxanthin glucosyltransferase
VSTIAFCMYPEPGHTIPSLRLAQGLKSAGHRVVYLVLPDMRDWVEALGFETVVVMAERLPLGTIRKSHLVAEPNLLALLTQILLAFRHMLLDGEFDQLMRALAVDALVCDMMVYAPVLAAHAQGILAYNFNTELPESRAPGVPPPDSHLPYGDTPERAKAVEQAWYDVLHEPKSEAEKELTRLDGLLRERYGIPVSAIEERRINLALTTVPELIAGSPDFDFPRPYSERRHYIESLAHERAPISFPWSRLSPDKPLVFCSLGTQSYRIPGAVRFFSEVIAAAASRPDWQFVIALGTRWSASDFPTAPDNAILVQFAPQVQLLQRCSVVIHHAGMGTTKESITFGVPMVVFPLIGDQPGNGARIRHHGLGEVGDFHTVTTARLLDMIDRVRADSGMAERVATMRRSFEDIERRQPGLALIQKDLGARSRAPNR